MNKKAVTFKIALLIVAIVTVTVIVILFSHQTNQTPKADSTGSTQKGIQEVVNANNKFAFDLYSELDKSEQGNIFYSPYSISAALAMTYEGANGQTAKEIKSVFHFPENNILRSNFAAIYNDLNQKNKAFELKTGNALWVQNNFLLLKNYTSKVENYYGGKAANLDFVSKPEESRQTINSFIEQQTNNKIKDLIPEGLIDSMTRLVLTNAIYFKGTWKWGFSTSDTRNENFKITENNTVKTPMMHMNPNKATFNYADLDTVQILELPYKGEKISMLLLLPKQGEDFDRETGKIIRSKHTLKDINLSFEKLNEYKSQMKETKLDSISLPTFEFDTKYSMGDTLSNLGMPSAFSSGADFSGMTGNKDLFIGFVIHQAYIKVNEKGTEAAAATAVGMKLTSAMPTNFFRADHPFIFIIQEKETGNILFMGRVTDPTQ